MRRILTLALAATTATLWVVGCGSDSSSPGGAAGAAGAAADAQCHGDYAALTQAKFNAALMSSGQCIGSSDRVAVCGQDITKTAEECGSSCFMMGGDDATQDGCVKTCIGSSASPALSAACVGCYVTDVACARTHCLLKCGINPTSADCAACRVEFDCAQTFFQCSGLPDGSEPTGAAGAGSEDSVAASGAAGN